MSILRHALVLNLAVVTFLAVAPAAAQQAAQPERSVSTYGNWELRCETTQRDGASVEACEIAQVHEKENPMLPPHARSCTSSHKRTPRLPKCRAYEMFTSFGDA